MYGSHMYVALPFRRQHQRINNIFAAAEKLQKSGKRNAPVLENEKAGVLILNQPTCAIFGGLIRRKGVMP